MKEHNDGLCLGHAIEIEMPYKRFDKDFIRFKKKHRRNLYRTNWFVYSTNSDGKFRLELKEDSESEDYIIRISGWKRGSPRKPNVELKRIYVSEDGLKLYEWVYDFLDLIEEWAVKYKGYFYFKYVDFDLPILDAYNIISGLEKDTPLSDWEMQELLHRYGYSATV